MTATFPDLRRPLFITVQIDVNGRHDFLSLCSACLLLSNWCYLWVSCLCVFLCLRWRWPRWRSTSPNELSGSNSMTSPTKFEQAVICLSLCCVGLKTINCLTSLLWCVGGQVIEKKPHRPPRPTKLSSSSSSTVASVPHPFSTLLPGALSAILRVTLPPHLTSNPKPRREPSAQGPLTLEQLQTELRDLRDEVEMMKSQHK